MARLALLALIAVALAAGARAQGKGKGKAGKVKASKKAKAEKARADTWARAALKSSKGKSKSCQKQGKGRRGTMNGERTNGSGDCIVEVSFSQMDIGVIRSIAGGSGTDWCYEEGNIADIAVQLNNAGSAMANNLSAGELFNAIKSFLGKPCKKAMKARKESKRLRKKVGKLKKKAKKQAKALKRQNKALKKGQFSGTPIKTPLY